MTMRKFLAHITAGGYACLFDPRQRPARRALGLLVGIYLLVSSAPAAANSTTREQQDTQTVAVDGETRVYVKNSRGKTIIVGKLGATEVTVRAFKFVRAQDSRTAEEWMNELSFTIDSDGEQISIVSRHPEWARESRNFWSFLKRIKQRVYIDYTIEVPADFSAKVSSTSGDVSVTSLGGDVKLFGSSGDVFMKQIRGDVFIELSSGDVEVYETGGNLSVQGSSGDMSLYDTGGRLLARGSSGDVTVYRVGGDADISVAAGDVYLNSCGGDALLSSYAGDIRLSEIEGSATATATSGDIEATIDPFGPKDNVFKSSSGDVDVYFRAREGYGFLLDVSTNNGAIEGDLDIELDKISRKLLRGVVGTGDGRVNIETASGDIRIKQVED
jgi:hypothetical protein